MLFESIGETIEQCIALTAVMGLILVQFGQVLSTSQSVQPTTTPGPVVEDSMQIRSCGGASLVVVVLDPPESVVGTKRCAVITDFRQSPVKFESLQLQRGICAGQSAALCRCRSALSPPNTVRMGSSASPGTCPLGVSVWGSPSRPSGSCRDSPIICMPPQMPNTSPPAWRSPPAQHRGQCGANWPDPAGSVCCLESPPHRACRAIPQGRPNAVEPWAPPPMDPGRKSCSVMAA